MLFPTDSPVNIGFVGRNLWLHTSKDIVHGWNPSELMGSWSENALLPRTGSFGFNLRLTFLVGTI